MTKKIALLLLVFIIFAAIPSVPRVQAAAPAATSMCEPIGVVGNVIISRCLDEETGIILYVNSAGFMMLGE